MKKLEIDKVKITITVFIIGICIACVLGMFRPGIHFMPGFVHANVKDTCYVYDFDQEKFIGQTEVVIKGNDIMKKFSGKISVVGYEVTNSPVDSIMTDKNDSIWSVSYTGIGGSMIADTEGGERWESEFDKYLYYLEVDKDNSDTYVITIVDTETNKNLYAIHAESEEKAWGVFHSLVLKGYPLDKVVK
ncbi:MAG TPA: hypothetical protein DDY31_13610 [Lachnospiraceae bacterium]|nr:hypothetical protein [Lachnospiraceae bacterium]